ncbi:hypothetical protein QBC40DRAFT_287547 [Triangularia verruculosa]|uniref:SUN domain-containing protein n=1 Tax=Triangularia verruculosa TaxID=2587418 RepID=A0AAN7AR51_9PEZI|nr:hypothetical protein QBC40DRAFT_287547 [Triangularia verruculosa]
MTDALSSPTTALHISLNLSQRPFSRDTSPYTSLNYNSNPTTLLTMPPRQRPGRGGNVPSPSPQQPGRAGTPSSVRSTRKPVDAGAVRVDVPVKYSTSYGSAMATLPDRVRIMGGGNVRNAVHGALEQIIKDNEAADVRKLAKEQGRASRTKTSSPQPQQPVQPLPPVQAPVKTTLSQQLSRSGSEETDEQEEGMEVDLEDELEEDGPSQQTLVESQHSAITSTRGGLLSRKHSRTGPAVEPRPPIPRPRVPPNPSKEKLDELMAEALLSSSPTSGSRKRPRDSFADEYDPNESSPDMDAIRKRIESLRRDHDETSSERAEAHKARHEDIEKQRREEREMRHQEMIAIGRARIEEEQAEMANSAFVPPVVDRNPSVPFPVLQVPRPPSFSVHDSPGVTVPRPPVHVRPQPLPTSNTVGTHGKVTNNSDRSWQEENTSLDRPISSPTLGRVTVPTPPRTLEDALTRVTRPSVEGVDVQRKPSNGVTGRRKPKLSDSSSSSSSDEDRRRGHAKTGARYRGRLDNRRTGRDGANRYGGYHGGTADTSASARIARARQLLGNIFWPSLRWFLAVSFLIGTLSVLFGPNGPSVPSFPSFSSDSLSGSAVVFTEEQYADFKNFWAQRSTATEVALRKIRDTLPKVVHVTKDKSGNILVAKEFWEAILGRVRHEPSILKIENGKISEDHWDAIRSRIKHAGLDQSFEDWFEKNKHRISNLFSGHPIAKQPASEKETYQDTVTGEQYYDNLHRQITSSRKDFEKELDALRKELHGLIEDQKHRTGGLTKKDVQKLIKEIVDKELGSSVIRPGKESPVAAINNMLSRHVNWFSFGNGAQIDTSITSPTFRPDRPVMGSVAWLRAMAKKPQFLHDSFHATSLWTDSGHCWCAGIYAGKNKEKLSADIGIVVAGLIIPKYIVVENINPGATTDPGAMPKDIEVWAKFENKDKAKQLKKWMATQFPTAAKDPGNAGRLHHDFVQIGTFTYEYRHVDNGVFIHKLSDDLIALDAVVETLLIRAVTNNGSPDHTCFYRLRLYGQEVDEDTGKHIGQSSW